MPPYRTADMHLHSEISDGQITIEDLAKSIGRLNYCTAEDVLKSTGLDALRVMMETCGMKSHVAALDYMIGKGVSVSKRINTVCKLDHNTLLGSEEFITAMQKYSPRTRVVVGAELTALADIPHIGWHALHIPVYFHDSRGFDLSARSKQGRDDFFGTIAEDYLGLLNRLNTANNFRYSESMRKSSNGYFFSGDERITSDTLQCIAKEKLTGMLDSGSILNAGNNVLAIHSNDIIEALLRLGIREEPEFIHVEHFRRNGTLYVPLTPTEGTVLVEELLEELGSISAGSDVKVKRGAGHPATYVRLMANAMLRSVGRNPVHFNDTEECRAATGEYMSYLGRMGHRGLLDFVEAEYPRYTIPVPGSAEKNSVLGYMEFINNEMGFVDSQRQVWRDFAASHGLGISGGSDSHFNGASGALACGFCDVELDDSYIDNLFSR